VTRVLCFACSIFDFGGSIGNLFYLYDRYLNLPPRLHLAGL
jgi:hypothetical protein